MQSLADHPARGSDPPELASLGIKAYRQLVVSPYRVIYRVDDSERRAIYVVADDRRDFQALLTRRLLGA
jgi:toxin ParE1/3/4